MAYAERSSFFVILSFKVKFSIRVHILFSKTIRFGGIGPKLERGGNSHDISTIKRVLDFMPCSFGALTFFRPFLFFLFFSLLLFL